MTKPMPYARVYLNDLMGECLGRGLGLRARGILLSLLWIQHLDGGTVPASLSELRRRIGDEVKDAELAAVVSEFFPVTANGRRANQQHAQAYADATKAYTASVRRGQITAGKRWGTDSPTTSQTNSQTTSQTTRSPVGRRSQTSSQTDSNQNQSQYLEPELNYGHPEEEKKGDAYEGPDDDAVAEQVSQLGGDGDDGDDEIPF